MHPLVSFPGQPGSAKAPLKVLSLAKTVDWSIEIGRQLMTAQYRPSITESFQARLTRLGGNQGRSCGAEERSKVGRPDIKCHLHKLLLLLPRGLWLWGSRGGEFRQPGQTVHVDCIRSLVGLVPNIDALCKAKRA